MAPVVPRKEEATARAALLREVVDMALVDPLEGVTLGGSKK